MDENHNHPHVLIYFYVLKLIDIHCSDICMEIELYLQLFPFLNFEYFPMDHGRLDMTIISVDIVHKQNVQIDIEELVVTHNRNTPGIRID